MEPATFDRVKVGIAVPTAGLIRAACCFSLLQVVGTLAQKRLWPEAKEQGLTILMREGSGIAPNREKMVEEAIANDCTHVCFVDDDMSFEPAAFESLARRRLPVVGCNYRMKFPPAQFTAVHLEKERGRMETTQDSTGLEPVSYMGFGLSLIETRVFKALDKPWFLNRYIEGVYSTEDLPFYWAAREQLGIISYCDQDASKLIGHIGIHDYRWHQPWPPSNPPAEASSASAETAVTATTAAPAPIPPPETKARAKPKANGNGQAKHAAG